MTSRRARRPTTAPAAATAALASLVAAPRSPRRRPRARGRAPAARRAAPPRAGPLKLLILMSDTGGGHRASAQALAGALERLHPGAFDVDVYDIWTHAAPWPLNRVVEFYRWIGARPACWRLLWYGTAAPGCKLTNRLGLWPVRAPFARASRRRIPTWSPRCAGARARARDDGARLRVSAPPARALSHPRALAAPSPAPGPPAVPGVPAHGGRACARRRAGACRSRPSSPTSARRTDAVRQPRRRVLRARRARRAARARARLCRERSAPAAVARRVRRARGRGRRGAARERRARRRGSAARRAAPACRRPRAGRAHRRRRRGMGGSRRSSTRRGRARRRGARGDARRRVRRNEGLRPSSPRATGARVGVVVQGFVANMHEWMAAADVLLSKAGPGTIAEASTIGLPVLLTSHLPGQEAGNVRYVVDGGFGAYATAPPRIAAILKEWLQQPEKRVAMRAAARAAATDRDARHRARPRADGDVEPLPATARARGPAARHRTMSRRRFPLPEDRRARSRRSPSARETRSARRDLSPRNMNEADLFPTPKASRIPP